MPYTHDLEKHIDELQELLAAEQERSKWLEAWADQRVNYGKKFYSMVANVGYMHIQSAYFTKSIARSFFSPELPPPSNRLSTLLSTYFTASISEKNLVSLHLIIGYQKIFRRVNRPTYIETKSKEILLYKKF
jgi:hypothetical protein